MLAATKNPGLSPELAVALALVVALIAAGGAIVAAIITARRAATRQTEQLKHDADRQARQLEHDAARQERELRHDRAMRDLQELRATLDVATASLQACFIVLDRMNALHKVPSAGSPGEREALASDFMATWMDAVTAEGRIALRLASDSPARKAFVDCVQWLHEAGEAVTDADNTVYLAKIDQLRSAQNAFAHAGRKLVASTLTAQRTSGSEAAPW